MRTLLEVPVGTVVWRDFADLERRVKRYRSKVYGYKVLYDQRFRF